MEAETVSETLETTFMLTHMITRRDCIAFIASYLIILCSVIQQAIIWIVKCLFGRPCGRDGGDKGCMMNFGGEASMECLCVQYRKENGG
jgi:hypothetical protein